MKEYTPPKADYTEVWLCDSCRDVHMSLHDKDDKVIAQCCMDEKTWLEVFVEITLLYTGSKSQ